MIGSMMANLVLFFIAIYCYMRRTYAKVVSWRMSTLPCLAEVREGKICSSWTAAGRRSAGESPTSSWITSLLDSNEKRSHWPSTTHILLVDVESQYPKYLFCDHTPSPDLEM